MAITPAAKSARGLGLQPTIQFAHISEGTRPKLPTLWAATYLPIQYNDERFNEGYVVRAGQIVSRDVSARSAIGGDIVLANGGTGHTLTYTSLDVSKTVDIDGGGNLYDLTATLVSAAGTSSATIAANTPIGWAAYNMYSGAVRLLYSGKNYDIQPRVGILNRGLVEFPITRTAQANFDEGTLVQPQSGTGWAVYWDPASDSVDQICGRVLWRDALTRYPGNAELAKVRAVPDTGVSSSQTDGLPAYLYNQTHQSGGGAVATEYVRVNISLLG